MEIGDAKTVCSPLMQGEEEGAFEFQEEYLVYLGRGMTLTPLRMSLEELEKLDTFVHSGFKSPAKWVGAMWTLCMSLLLIVLFYYLL
jgi:hypothetical protein